MYICEKCGCDDPKYFAFNKGRQYCRRCISFLGNKALTRKIQFNKEIKPNLKYPLTSNQKKISKKVATSIRNKKNVLIHAVCGAGKTEIVFEAIADTLNKHKQVGFCIPRKDVVIELEPRIKEAFPQCEVISIYGGHNEKLEGDIILLTTHQLYRYIKYFDLLIIDETDAFPFSNNEVLMNMFNTSIKGNYIMMSATPLRWMKEKIKKDNGVYLSLLRRFHGHNLIVPKLEIAPFFLEFKLIKKLKEFKQMKKQCFIFCPTISISEQVFKLLSLVFKSVNFVNSKRDDRENIIDDFKKNKFQFLITTSLLERGVTIKDVQVIVYDASNKIYTSEMLIQIAGRVGRKMDAYDGEVLFLAKKSTVFIEIAIDKIKEANEYGLL